MQIGKDVLNGFPKELKQLSSLMIKMLMLKNAYVI